MRRSAKRAAQNAVVRSAYKNALKVAKQTQTAGEELTKLLVAAQQKLDKAAKRGVIKKKTAARKLSRLMKRMMPVAEKKKI